MAPSIFLPQFFTLRLEALFLSNSTRIQSIFKSPFRASSLILKSSSFVVDSHFRSNPIIF